MKMSISCSWYSFIIYIKREYKKPYSLGGKLFSVNKLERNTLIMWLDMSVILNWWDVAHQSLQIGR